MKKNFRVIISLILPLLFYTSLAMAEENKAPPVKTGAIETNASIDTLEYYKNAAALTDLRNSRQLSIAEIIEMLKDKGTVLLDTRGDADYAKLHIKGAKHLSYADMNTERLAKMYPDKNTRIIVYCDSAIVSPLTRMMPLSSNAFIDLNMYGYKNIYEMRSIMKLRPYQEQCKEILNIPFEGEHSAITVRKKMAVQCLSSR
jgi:rhodanese-related sulfurtransferase